MSIGSEPKETYPLLRDAFPNTRCPVREVLCPVWSCYDMIPADEDDLRDHFHRKHEKSVAKNGIEKLLRRARGSED